MTYLKRGAEPEVEPTMGEVYDSMGFHPIDPEYLLAHDDGRVAVLLPNGNHQVHGSLLDAMRWRFAELQRQRDENHAAM